MANPSTLYRFKINLSDIDRSVYESLDLRVARHPSETEDFLVTRVLAYALNFVDGLLFSPGLSTPDEPAIKLTDTNGGVRLWIDIGNPTARRLNKASKAAKSVRVYTYKDPENLIREAANERIYNSSEIEIYSLASSLLNPLGQTLARDNCWAIIHNDSELTVSLGEESFTCGLQRHRLEN